VSASAIAEQTATMHDGFVLGEQPSDQRRFSGHLDAIRDRGHTVIIDDTVLEVSPIITVDGVGISRERLSQKLNEGQKVEFSLSGDLKAGKQLTEILTK
jgi:hypothetical protein